jgi:hypothetical protein
MSERKDFSQYSTSLRYNGINISNENFVKITVYVPISAKIALKRAKVSMSHLCRSAILRYLREKQTQRGYQMYKYHTDKKWREKRLENARKQKKL